MSDALRDACVVLLSLLGCAGILAGGYWMASLPHHPIPAPNCQHPVSLGDQPYCPTPVPTP